MLVGFNTNISYKDKIYHVQTEDSGELNPVVITLLYHEGAILASRKTDYSNILDDPEFKEKVTKLMKIQHKGMIRDLLAGKHTGHSPEREKESGAGAAEETKEVRGEQEETEGPPEPEKDQADGKEGALHPESVPESHRKQLSDSLDDILLTYILKREK